MQNRLKINAIQKFTQKAERAGYYAVCEVVNLENGLTAVVYLAAPIESSLPGYFNPKNAAAEIWNMSEKALYKFLSTEDFSKNKEFYFEWAADNQFHKLDQKPGWLSN